MDALTAFMGPLGFMLIMFGGIKFVFDLSRGYGSYSSPLGTMGLGAAMASSSLWLPKVNESFQEVVGNTTGEKPKAEDTNIDIPWDQVLPAMGWVLGISFTLSFILYICLILNKRNELKKGEKDELAKLEAEEQDRLTRVWNEAVARHDKVRMLMLKHQTDIDLILTMPTINDVEDEKTAAFVEALAQASDLAYDERPKTKDAIENYASATRKAENAWGVAWRHADRVRLSNFSASEIKNIKTAQKMLHRAEKGSTPHERKTYYEAAMRTLNKLIAVPEKAAEAIEASVRGELEAPKPANSSIFAGRPKNSKVRV